MTVNELKKLCNEQVKQGNGNKKIWISRDDEGNGFHELFYPFIDDEKTIKMAFGFCCQNAPENIVILG